MCARYGSAAEFNLLQKTYRVADLHDLELSQETIFPHRQAPVVVQNKDQRELVLMNYSLVPHWSKVRKPKFATYNARIEEITQKPTWREPLKRKHCLVPMTHFFESAHFGDFAGNLIKIEAPQQALLTAAGIWDEWRDPASKEVVHSFAILTKEPPADILAAGHDRCPVFLPESSFEEWLHVVPAEKKDWVQFLLKNNESYPFHFHIEAKLKSFKAQGSLF